MKQLSNLTKVMFCVVAILLVITVVLGIATAVKDGKEEKESNKGSISTTVTPVPTATPKPTEEDNSIPEVPITPEVEPTATPIPTEAPQVTASHRIALDPGQQKSAMTDDEPIGPGATATTDKMSYGATSVTTSKREYQWSLPFTLKVREELVARGYEVILTREEHDVKISNAERAQFVNESGADIYISIQADAASTASAKGIYAQIPSKDNAFVGQMYSKCKSLAKLIQSKLIAETGAKDRGVKETDTVAAINWSEVPVTVLQLGFMSNQEEDTNLWSEEYQDKMVKAICDGIDAYFESQNE